MAGKKVTDPELLKQLNGTGAPSAKKVTDPKLLHQLNGGSDDDFVDDADLDGVPDGAPAGLALPGTTPTEGYVQRDGKWFQATPGGLKEIDGPPQSRTFGLGSSDTLNPLPAIIAGTDRAVGNIPIIGDKLTGLRDQVNANIYGDTPADARADMDKNIEANPVPAKIGAAIGQASPYLAAAPFAPLAGALGLEGSILSRIIMGTASNIAIKTGDKMSEGEKPLEALGNASREGVAEAPFFALGTKSGRQATIANAPKTSKLFEEGGKAFDSVKDSKLVIAQPSADSFINSATSKAMSGGLDQGLTPQSVSVVQRMQQMSGRNMSIEDAMLLRKLANDAWDTAKPGSNDQRISRQIIRDLDDFLSGVATKGPQGQPNMAVLSGDPVKAKTALDEANKIWSAAHKAKTLDTAIELAVATSEKSGQSLDKTLRNEFGKLDREIIQGNPDRFSPEEIALIKEVTNGNGGRNLAAFLGNTLYPKGPISALPTLASGGGAFLGSQGNPVLTGLALGIPATTGAIGRTLSSAGAKESADFASASIRNKTLGTNIVPGNVLEASPVVKSLPSVGGRVLTTMTLNEYAQSR